METTEMFKNEIKKYLDAFASNDSVFAGKYADEKKSIDECVKYIINEVHKLGKNGFADAEIYGMAVHYYDEKNVGELKDIKARIVMNHEIELTEEEIKAAKQRAIDKVMNEQAEKMKKQTVKKETAKTEQMQLELF